MAASPQALASVARALQLTPAERAYLFQIAGRHRPRLALHPTTRRSDVPPALAEALASIAGPAYILDRLWNARACNDAARRLFVGWLDGEEPNLLRYVFLNPVARQVIPDWTERARRVLAEFRAESSRHLDDLRCRAGRRSAGTQRFLRPLLGRARGGGPAGRRARFRAPTRWPTPLRADCLHPREPGRSQAGNVDRPKGGGDHAYRFPSPAAGRRWDNRPTRGRQAFANELTMTPAADRGAVLPEGLPGRLRQRPRAGARPPARAMGTVLHLQGRVLDAAGKPLTARWSRSGSATRRASTTIRASPAASGAMQPSRATARC